MQTEEGGRIGIRKFITVVLFGWLVATQANAIVLELTAETNGNRYTYHYLTGEFGEPDVEEIGVRTITESMAFE